MTLDVKGDELQKSYNDSKISKNITYLILDQWNCCSEIILVFYNIFVKLAILERYGFMNLQISFACID